MYRAADNTGHARAVTIALLDRRSTWESIKSVLNPPLKCGMCGLNPRIKDVNLDAAAG